MLQPKKTKHRKMQKGRSRKRAVETRGTQLHFGTYGLQALGMAYINSKQLEAARKTISHFTRRGGKIWIRVFPDKPITKRPPEVTMGGGKGSVEYYVFPAKPGRILFEVDGLPPKTAIEALQRAGHKLPLKTRVVSR
jgi:large subunit ribosomal protein L16